MKIIEDISFHGHRNVIDRNIILPKGVEHIIFTGFDIIEKSSILDALAFNKIDTISINSNNAYQVVVWNRDDVNGNIKKLKQLQSTPTILIIEEAEYGLDTQHQKEFLSELTISYPNIQVFASTSSPFIFPKTNKFAIYNLESSKLYTDLEKKKYDELGQIAFCL